MDLPKVGRILHFFDENHEVGRQPKAAIITYVHGPYLVNLAVFTTDGHAGAYQDVVLVEEDGGLPNLPFAAWPVVPKREASLGDKKPGAVPKQKEDAAPAKPPAEPGTPSAEK